MRRRNEMTNAQTLLGGMVWMAIAGVLMLGALRPTQDEAKAGAAHQLASTHAAGEAISA
jgi:hypothetical protein